MILGCALRAYHARSEVNGNLHDVATILQDTGMVHTVNHQKRSDTHTGFLQ